MNEFSRQAVHHQHRVVLQFRGFAAPVGTRCFEKRKGKGFLGTERRGSVGRKGRGRVVVISAWGVQDSDNVIDALTASGYIVNLTVRKQMD